MQIYHKHVTFCITFIVIKCVCACARRALFDEVTNIRMLIFKIVIYGPVIIKRSWRRNIKEIKNEKYCTEGKFKNKLINIWKNKNKTKQQILRQYVIKYIIKNITQYWSFTFYKKITLNVIFYLTLVIFFRWPS